MLNIETDGTVTYRDIRIGAVVLDNPTRDEPKIGGLLRESPLDEIERLEGQLSEGSWDQCFYGTSNFEDAISEIELILKGEGDEKGKLVAIEKAIP